MWIGRDPKQTVTDGLKDIEQDIKLEQHVGRIASAEVFEGRFTPEGCGGVLVQKGFGRIRVCHE